MAINIGLRFFTKLLTQMHLLNLSLPKTSYFWISRPEIRSCLVRTGHRPIAEKRSGLCGRPKVGTTSPKVPRGEESPLGLARGRWHSVFWPRRSHVSFVVSCCRDWWLEETPALERAQRRYPLRDRRNSSFQPSTRGTRGWQLQNRPKGEEPARAGGGGATEVTTTGVSAGGKPAAAGLSEPDKGSKERLQLGLQGLCLRQEEPRSPLGVFSPGSITTVLKGGHPRLPALPPWNRGAHDATRGGRVGRGMALGVGGSRFWSPRRLRGNWRTGLGRWVPRVTLVLQKGHCFV